MKLNIAVFFGGESVEHEVSIISAHQAIEALDKNKYNVIPVYVSKERKLYVSDLLKDISNYKDLKHLISQCTQVSITSEDNRVVIRPVKPSLFGPKELGTIDVAIPVMHGTNGEDGTIQGFFEMLKVPYAGCDLYGAAIGQDKVLQKNVLNDNNLPITNWFWVYGSEMDTHQSEILDKVHRLIYPVIIKPARTGSSVGISIAHNDEEYLACFDEARQYDEKIITEKVVKPMREINCSVVGDSYSCVASVLEEVSSVSQDELLSFSDKYLGGSKSAKSEGSKGMASTARIVPAPLTDEQTRLIQQLAKETFRVLGTSGVCRIDFLMDADTKKVYVNEINTIPGSLAFYLWKAAGVSFSELMDKLVELALDRERRRSKMTFSYETNILSNFSASSAKGSKGSKM
ncbi:D-alanine--D-alanine ligase family protein [Solobacterium moorei]|uniref:D-alanine--D-alanine ligase n=2 Tax=Solobacterium moorei TaxID=102148 RepID=E7MPQ2_9FIRM|nr:D-alanine--D-alanine ligase family protein [Solobacterium moorei]EFW23938.1 D-ala D-ala ligase N-terminal domain protein [Solobacterium moorei F0204]RGT58066.1 D-alanine--D-alanine ligase [Solobacterium moorei]